VTERLQDVAVSEQNGGAAGVCGASESNDRGRTSRDSGASRRERCKSSIL